MASHLTEKFETIAKRLLHYSGFDAQYINGTWRAGRRLVDTDPYTGEPVASMGLADKSDVDEAFQAVAQAQPAWVAWTDNSATTLSSHRLALP